jgi:hypothetical protein
LVYSREQAAEDFAQEIIEYIAEQVKTEQEALQLGDSIIQVIATRLRSENWAETIDDTGIKLDRLEAARLNMKPFRKPSSE